jgi:ABC-2 type transport system permease protein
MTAADNLRVIAALARRAFNEILRVPGAAIPGILAPTIFMVGLSGVFGAAANVPGFDADFRTFIVPVGMLQGAGFTGAATGVNLARDIEQGWFDRLLVGPAPRTVLLTGIVSSAAVRCLLPATFLVAVALILGTHVESVPGLLLAAALIMVMAAAMACWGSIVALRFGTQQAAPLMQIAGLIAVLFTTAYAPMDLLAGWLRAIATVNPVTRVLEGVRQGFVGPVTWGDTWPALVALGAMLVVLGALATWRLSAVDA